MNEKMKDLLREAEIMLGEVVTGASAENPNFDKDAQDLMERIRVAVGAE